MSKVYAHLPMADERNQRSSAFVITALVFMLIAPACLSQTAGIPDGGNAGLPINGVFSGGSVDSVQLNNGDLHIDIPLLDLPGVGIPVSIHFVYDNKIWDYASGDGTYEVSQDRSPSIVSYPGDVHYSSVTTTPIVQCGSQSYPDTYLMHMSFVDEQGTAHPFNVNGYTATSPPCDYAPAPTLMYAADSSGIVGNRTPNQATLASAITKSGTVYTFPAFGDVVIEDSNGNKLTAVTGSGGTTITDTVGRVFTIAEATGGEPSSIAYTDQNGKPQTITISYSTLAVNTAPLCAMEKGFFCMSTVPSSVSVPSVITLPGGYTYILNFLPNSLVDLESLTLPTGGVISWTYGQTDVSGDKVLTRTVTANGMTSVWKYNYAMSSSQGANTSNVVTVTDPFLNDTQYTCTIYAPKPLGLPSTTQLQPCYMTKEQAFTGSAASGSLITTKSTTYNVTGVVLPKSTTVTWASTGQVAETDTAWDSIPNSGFYTGSDNPANDVSRGNMLSRIDYDYGSGAHGALLKNTQNTYLYQQNSAYVAPNIVDRRYQQSIYNSATASASTLVAQTTTAYDQFNQASINGQAALLPTAGTKNHDYPNFGTSATLRGLPTSVTKVVGSGVSAISTYSDYNDLGSPTITTAGNRNSTTYSYGAQNAFLASVIQPTTSGTKHVDSYDHDLNTGLMMSHTDQNSILTNYSYDALGRLALVDSAPGKLDCCNNSAESKTAYTWQGATQVTVAQDQVTTGDGVLKSTTVLDGLGRTGKAVARDGSVVETAYDAGGRVCAISNPALAANAPTTLSCTVGQNKAVAATDGYTYYSYDALGRKSRGTQPDGTYQHWAYNGNVTDFYDEDNSHWQWTEDALGRLTKTLENDPGGSGSLTLETDYTYDALGDLLSVNQKGASGDAARYRTFVYDPLSRLTHACNPEAIATGSTCTPSAGPWSTVYVYDANGNVTSRTDARGIVTNYTYDALNRLTGKTYANDPANTPALSYGYDTEYAWQLVANENNPVGHLNSIMATLGTTNLVTWTSNDYDQRGRLLGYANCLGSNAQACPGFAAEAAYAFNLNEDLEVLGENATAAQNGEGQGISFNYDSAGRVSSIVSSISVDTSGNSLTSTAFSGLSYFPGGAVETANLAIDPKSNIAGIALTRTYDNRGRITAETDEDAQKQSAYKYTVSYDGNSNVTGYNDSVAGAWTVKLDALHRLSSSAGTVNGVAASFQETYDHFGNRNVEYYTYKGVQNNPFPYATFTAGNQIVNGTYDKAGNLLSDGTNNYLYDAEGRLCAAQQASTGGDITGYLYAPDGLRMGKGPISSFTCDMTKNGLMTASGLNLTSIYTVGPNGEQLEEVGTANNYNYKHFNVFWEGKLLGTYTGSTYAESNWHFTLNDWLGTKRQITTSAGAPTISFFSGPFGDYLSQNDSGADPSEQHFTGKERDTESGLDYFGARYYASTVGRFMSPDWNGSPEPVPSADLTNPQSLNLYGYVQSNPLTNVDPDGHDCIDTSNYSSDGTVTITRGDSCSSNLGPNGTYVNGTIDANSITATTNGSGTSFGYNFTSYDGQIGGAGVIAQAAPYGPLEGPANLAGANMIGNGGMGMVNEFMKSMALNAVGDGAVEGLRLGAEALMAARAAKTADAAGQAVKFGAGKSAAKWARQLLQRGWTENEIADAIANGKSVPATNNINPANGATRFISPSSGKSVVVDNVTGEVIHVGGPGFKY